MLATLAMQTQVVLTSKILLDLQKFAGPCRLISSVKTHTDAQHNVASLSDCSDPACCAAMHRLCICTQLCYSTSFDKLLAPSQRTYLTRAVQNTDLF